MKIGKHTSHQSNCNCGRVDEWNCKRMRDGRRLYLSEVLNKGDKMKTVFLYAGQGSQKTGMGKDFYEAFPSYRAVIDSLELSFDLKEMMHEGELAALSRTEYTQPCMAAFAAGVTAVLKEEGMLPDAVCGLSLGEYGALHAAGIFDVKDYVKITEFRGREMAHAAEGRVCSMSAVLGMEASVVEKVCAQCEDAGFVKLVNYNCPGQYVICGDEPAVAAAETMLKEKGAKRCIRLNVSGPFHTKYMEPAGKALRAFLEEIPFAEPQMNITMNVTGDFYRPSENLKELLEAQIQNSVHFESQILRFIEAGADIFVEIGPGNTLTGFVKKTAKEAGKKITAYTIDRAEDLKALIAKKEEIFS